MAASKFYLQFQIKPMITMIRKENLSYMELFKTYEI